MCWGLPDSGRRFHPVPAPGSAGPAGLGSVPSITGETESVCVRNCGQLQQGGWMCAGSSLTWSKLWGGTINNLLWKRPRWLRNAVTSLAAWCLLSQQRAHQTILSPGRAGEIMPIISSFLVMCDVFLTPHRVLRRKGPWGKKKICAYIYIYMCRVSFTLYYAGIFRSFKCRLRSRRFR